MSHFDQDAPDPHFLDESLSLSLDRMLALSGLTRVELVELVEHGVFGATLHDTGIEHWRFAGRSALLARRALHLRRAFELDVDATSLLVALLERMDELQQRVRELECQLIRQE